MRLIDADALKYKQQVMYKKGDSDEVFAEWFITATEINNAPTINTAPARHAKWVESKLSMYRWGGEKTGEKSTWKCSVCHNVGFWRYNYCPGCGAKMDGGDTDA